jgi:hypothetical protein
MGQIFNLLDLPLLFAFNTLGLPIFEILFFILSYSVQVLLFAQALEQCFLYLPELNLDSVNSSLYYSPHFAHYILYSLFDGLVPYSTPFIFELILCFRS